MERVPGELLNSRVFVRCRGLASNRGRPHASLGPGIPDPAHDWLAPPSSGHRIRDGYRVVAKPVLGGLHHEYRLEAMAA